MIVFFGNGVLGGEPQILLRIYRIAEACSCKALDGFIGIVNTLNDTCSVEIMDQFTGLGAAVNTSSALPGPGTLISVFL